jgi:hypothetical protein
LVSFFLFIYFAVLGLNLGPSPWATPPSPLLFCAGFFWDRILQTICLGWLQTMILLISASWVGRMTGVSYHSPAYFWYCMYYNLSLFLSATLCTEVHEGLYSAHL